MGFSEDVSYLLYTMLFLDLLVVADPNGAHEGSNEGVSLGLGKGDVARRITATATSGSICSAKSGAACGGSTSYSHIQGCLRAN